MIWNRLPENAFISQKIFFFNALAFIINHDGAVLIAYQIIYNAKFKTGEGLPWSITIHAIRFRSGCVSHKDVYFQGSQDLLFDPFSGKPA